jgi:hypothetical protein
VCDVCELEYKVLIVDNTFGIGHTSTHIYSDYVKPQVMGGGFSSVLMFRPIEHRASIIVRSAIKMDYNHGKPLHMISAGVKSITRSCTVPVFERSHPWRRY